MRDDYLFRVSLKALIFNGDGKLFVVKETGRQSWDLPGGGMDHGETFKQALARELYEEAGLAGNFTYELLFADDPKIIERRHVYQIRLVFRVTPEVFPSGTGDEADEAAYVDPSDLDGSPFRSEQLAYGYCRQLGQV